VLAQQGFDARQISRGAPASGAKFSVMFVDDLGVEMPSAKA